jgi:hypothetical protein
MGIEEGEKVEGKGMENRVNKKKSENFSNLEKEMVI